MYLFRCSNIVPSLVAPSTTPHILMTSTNACLLPALLLIPLSINSLNVIVQPFSETAMTQIVVSRYIALLVFGSKVVVASKDNEG